MVYKQAEQVEWRKFENESLLLNVDTGVYFRINEVASLIWENLDGQRTAEEIIQVIVKHFDVSETVALQDYQKFIKQLLENNLIKVVEAH